MKFFILSFKKDICTKTRYKIPINSIIELLVIQIYNIKNTYTNTNTHSIRLAQQNPLTNTEIKKQGRKSE